MTETGSRPIISDAKIAAYLGESKRLPANWLQTLQMEAPQRGHRGSALEVVGADGNRYEIRLRQAALDPLAFSAILFILDIDGLRRFRLKRYNGRSHGHRNPLEQQRFGVGFHIHTATERYQLAGFDEDTYAEVTDRYGNVWEALECLLSDCGFQDDQGSQLRLI
jgi:hypothetical protein